MSRVVIIAVNFKFKQYWNTNNQAINDGRRRKYFHIQSEMHRFFLNLKACVIYLVLTFYVGLGGEKIEIFQQIIECMSEKSSSEICRKNDIQNT